MKKIISLIFIFGLFYSCKKEAKPKFDISKIEVSNSSSFRTHKFDNLKSIEYKISGEILRNEILNIWNSEKIFIGEEINETKIKTEKNLIFTLENTIRTENGYERVSKVELIKNKIIEYINNLSQFDNIIIEYSTITESGETIESSKTFKIK